MKDFPEIYDDDEIEKMFGELGMDEEKRELLASYFKAFAEFYGIITLDKAFSIIDEQNPGMFSKEEFLGFAEIERHAQRYYSVLGNDELYEDVENVTPMQRKIVTEWLYAVDLDDFYEMEELQEGKPYYIPEKQELLKYAGDHYIESTPQTEAILSFLTDEVGCAPERADDLLGDIVLSVRVNTGECKIPFSDMARMFVKFTPQQAVRFAELYIDLFNNTRHYFNRGCTPVEMKKRALPFSSPDKEDEFSGYYESYHDVCIDPVKEAKVGWNYWERNRKMLSSITKSVRKTKKTSKNKKGKKKKK